MAKEKFDKISKSLKILFCFLQLLATPNVKNSHILAEKYFIFLKKCPTPNLQVFEHKIWIFVCTSKKSLPSKTNFSTFLQLSCSSFWLKLW